VISGLTAYAQIEQKPVAADPESAGITPITGDVNLWFENGGGSSYWRPDCDTLSNGNAIVLGGMRKAPFADHSLDSENTRDMAAVFSPAGELIEPARCAFFTNAGAPWDNTICTARNDDKFYGLCADTVGERLGDRYVVHTIANPDQWPDAFPGYAKEQRYEYHTAIQVIHNDGTPETPLINPYGDYVTERGLLRGGTVRFLSNGNIIMNFEDRQTGTLKKKIYNRTYSGRVVGVVIMKPDGSIVKGPFAICSDRPGDSSNRFGLASGKGWFAVRYDDAVTGPTIAAFDNDGHELGDGSGRLYPALDIPELGGDGGNRGDPNGLEAVGNTLYVTHRGIDRAGYLSTIHVGPEGLSVIRTIRFTDLAWSTFEHNADLGVDSAGNVIVMWQDQAWERFQSGRWEVLARMFDANLDPLTSSFCIFEIGNNTDMDAIDPILGPGRTKQSRIAMNDDIIIAIAETNNVPYGDPTSASNEMFTYTYIARLLKNPTNTPVQRWELY
ncbi:MAG: hypothetical protein ACP5I1_10085, partial [Candidatus Hinthialibacter sp.]